jgi:hypothetical protein
MVKTETCKCICVKWFGEKKGSYLRENGIIINRSTVFDNNKGTALDK